MLRQRFPLAPSSHQRQSRMGLLSGSNQRQSRVGLLLKTGAMSRSHFKVKHRSTPTRVITLPRCSKNHTLLKQNLPNRVRTSEETESPKKKHSKPGTSSLQQTTCFWVHGHKDIREEILFSFVLFSLIIFQAESTGSTNISVFVDFYHPYITIKPLCQRLSLLNIIIDSFT